MLILSICKCFSDLNGFGFSDEENEKLRHILSTKLKQLETTAYKLADKTFQLNSPTDVCQILYQELRLPINGEAQNENLRPPVSIKGRRFGLRNKVPMSSSKDILMKLKNLHELPGVIIDWRKINSALSNSVVQFSRVARKHNLLRMKRIYPTSNVYTATGRMTMQEPSIQMVPRDFEVNLSSSIIKNTKDVIKFDTDTNTEVANRTMLMTSFESFIDRNEGMYISY